MKTKITLIEYGVNGEHIVRHLTNIAITRGLNTLLYSKDNKDYLIFFHAKNDIREVIEESNLFLSYDKSMLNQLSLFVETNGVDADANMTLSFEERKITKLM